MKTTKQNRREAKRLFHLCMTGGVLDEDRVRQILRRINQAHRHNRLAILKYFQRLVKLELGRHTATVESTMPLPPELQTGLQARLGQIYGPGLHTSFVLNPALIGGMRIKAGCDLYDGSVLGRLTALESGFGSARWNGGNRALIPHVEK